VISSLNKDIIALIKVPLMTSFQLNYLFKDPISKHSHTYSEVLVLGPQYLSWERDTIQLAPVQGGHL
jgi:hypothetical protein